MKNLQNYELFVMLSFAIASFISIAIGNVFLGIAVALFLVYAYKNKIVVPEYAKGYFIAIAVFVGTMFVSALLSGDIVRGLKVWIDMWIYRFMPFVIMLLCLKDEFKSKKVLCASIVGLIIAMCYASYQGLMGNTRANGFYGHPMTLAAFLCVYLPLFLVVAWDKYFSKKQRIIALALFILGFVALLFNGTRGAWLALVIALSCVVLYSVMQNKKQLLAVLLVLFVVGAALGTNNHFINRVKSIGDTQNASNNQRFMMWQSAYHMLQDHPVLGVGLGQYAKEYKNNYVFSPKNRNDFAYKEIPPKQLNWSYDALKEYKHAHSNFFHMLAENGILGCLSFIAMFGYFILRNLKTFLRNRNPYALIIVASTTALMLQGLTEYNFGNSAVVKAYWLAMGCLVVLSEGYNQKTKN